MREIISLNEGWTLRFPKGERAAEKPVTEALYALGGIEYVNIVAQSDEIGS